MIAKIDTSKVEWDFSPLFKGDLDEAIEKDKKIIREKVSNFVSKWKKDNRYLKDVLVLKEALDEYEDLMKNYETSGNIGYYLGLMEEKDEADEKIKSRSNLVTDFSLELSNELEFFDLNLSKIPKEKQKEFLSSDELEEYRHYLERLFSIGKHLLSEDEEKIMNLKSGSAYGMWVKMVSEAFSKEEAEVFTGEKNEYKNFSVITSFMNNSNKEVRDSCAKAFNNILKKHLDIATAEINAILQDKKVNDSLRGYSRPDESRILSDDIDEEFVDSLMLSVSKRMNISNRFYELKAKLFGLKKLAYHERNIVYGDIGKKFSYDESAKIVYDSINNFNSEFGKIVKKLIEGGNIDVYPSKGKRGGAFCSSGLKIHPTYVLLNHTNEFSDVETMAHELGHAINHELIKEQNSLNFGVPMATAEVASNFAENIFFEDFLGKVKNEEEKLAILIFKLNGDISSVMRQISCYMFELALHGEFRKKGYLSKEDIGKLFQENMKRYIGDFVSLDEGSQNWWTYWSHIRTFFYVYSYASGVLIAKMMIAKVKEDPNFMKNIRDFFSDGRSVSPRESFKKMGLEINKEFWDAGLDELEKSVDDAWKLARKLGKI